MLRHYFAVVMLLKKYDKANVSSYALIVQKKQKALQCLLDVYNWHGPFHCSFNLEHFH